MNDLLALRPGGDRSRPIQPNPVSEHTADSVHRKRGAAGSKPRMSLGTPKARLRRSYLKRVGAGL